jgi:regulatory protein
MELSISIVKLVSHRMGDEAELTVRIAPKGAEDQRADVRRIFVASKMLFEIGNIGVGSLPYALTKEQFDTLEYDASLWEAVKKGIDILSYGDNTKSTLITKLRQRGFDRYLSEDAADYIAGLGYIDESRMLSRAVDQLANTKLYGPSRIKNELRKKGISQEILRDELDALLEEIDFEANLLRLAAKKCDMTRLADPKYRESVYAAFHRLGYSPSDTRAAIKTLQENEHE